MKQTVLIIEVDSPNVKLLAWGLREEKHFEVVVAGGKDEAEHTSVALRPDFIVFNTDMSRIDKRGWIQALRYIAPDVKVIDLHAKSGGTSTDATDDVGADGYLAEPYGVAALITLMDDLRPRRVSEPKPDTTS